VKALDNIRVGRAAAQFLANWTSAGSGKKPAVEQRNLRRALRVGMVAGRLDNLLTMPAARRAVLQFTMTAELAGRYGGEDVRRMEKDGTKEHHDQEHVIGTGLEHDSCAAVLSSLSTNPGSRGCASTAGEGITGPAWVIMYAVMVSQEMSWWTAAALTQWGREVSRARSLERRRKKLEISEISRQQRVAVVLLELPVYDFKTVAMGVRRLQEHAQELSGAFPLANLGWVEQLVVQVRSVKAVIAALALGLRWGN
jgi:hypothetical protein